MNSNKKYKLIIFDWDGTLMDSQGRIVDCLRHSQRDMKLTEKSDADLKNIIGLGLNEAIQTLYPDLSLKQVNKFADRYRQCYMMEEHQPLALFDQVQELLENLHQSGVMLAVATGKARRGLNHALNDVGLNNFFHASRCADETHSKPHPQMLEEILDEFALSPHEAIMVGDTEYDLVMANSINMDALAVSYGVHEEKRLLSFNPVACLPNVKELACFLNKVAQNYLD